MTMTFAPAKKEQLKARVAIAGPSGAGKTYTALRLAKGLAQGGTIALVDTERRSASLYADEFQFVTMDFTAPYRPDLLRDAIKAAEGIGATVLIIDSFTHFWSGPGGVLEIVDQNAKGGNSWSGWAVGTPLQQQVVDAMLTADLHVIVCMRSKQEWALQTNSKGKQEPTRVGMGVQQRGDIEYEFTIFGELDLSHKLSVTKSRCKKLADRVEMFPGETLAEELLDWLSSGEDPNAPFVDVGWVSQHEHDAARSALLERFVPLTSAQKEELSSKRQAAGLPSPGVGVVVSRVDMGKLNELVHAVLSGGAGDGEVAGAARQQELGEPDPDPEPAPAKERLVDAAQRIKAKDPIGEHVYKALEARMRALDADYQAEFSTMLGDAGLVGFTFKSTQDDAATVAGVLDLLEKRHQPTWDHRRKAVFAALTDFDPNMAKDDAVRHQFVKDATGDETESTAKLTQAQADAIIGAASEHRAVA